jgi:hypothetical protein
MAINGFSMQPSWAFLHGEGYRAYRLESGRLVALTEPGRYENLFFLPQGAP